MILSEWSSPISAPTDNESVLPGRCYMTRSRNYTIRKRSPVLEDSTAAPAPADSVRAATDADLGSGRRGFDPCSGTGPSPRGYDRRAWLSELEERLARGRAEGRPV